MPQLRGCLFNSPPSHVLLSIESHPQCCGLMSQPLTLFHPTPVQFLHQVSQSKFKNRCKYTYRYRYKYIHKLRYKYSYR